MEIGKLSTDALNSIVISRIKNRREEIMVRPGVGEDCAVVDFGDYACVLSSDPITGATKEVGKLAIHVCCNDIASNGVEPLGIMLTIMAPPETTEEQLRQVMIEAEEAAEELNIDIIGGHTEITTAVNRLIISATAIGRVEKERVVVSSGAKEGDAILVTKGVGLEGTAIIAAEMEDQLKTSLGVEIVEKSKAYINGLSVVKEGIIAGRLGASSMHDVTEGGLLGGLWELCEASRLGARIYFTKIPISKETIEVSKFFSLDPLRLISSGSMLITMEPSKVDDLIKALEKEGISCTVIGEMTGNKKTLVHDDREEEITPPVGDELYKVIK